MAEVTAKITTPPPTSDSRPSCVSIYAYDKN